MTCAMSRRLRWRAVLGLCAVLVASPLPGRAEDAPQAVVASRIADAAPVGSGTYSYLFWDLYQATLYAPGGRWQAGGPFALALRYLMDIEGRKIASVSRDEIARQGGYSAAQLDAWEAEMTRIFPDVTSGSVLIGMRLPDGTTRFHAGEREIGSIADPAFGKAFFDIWLGEATRDRALRRQLLGAGH